MNVRKCKVVRTGTGATCTPIRLLLHVATCGNTPLRLSTFRLLQFRLVYYAFYNFAWNVPVRHLICLKNVTYNVAHIFSYSGFPYWCSLLVIDFQQMLLFQA